MSFFPMFMNMTDLRVLVVGGGHIATEKLEKLVDFTSHITIIAQSISPQAKAIAEQYSLNIQEKLYQTGDIEGFDIVIVATDTQDLHAQIYQESRNSRILVNSVDNTAYCDFIFPSYIKKEDLTIAFSTGGTSPAFAKHIRRHFEQIIPDSVGGFLKKMKQLRSEIPKGKERMKKFDKMAKDFIDKW